MSGHTPGPWRIEPKPYSQFYIQITGIDLKAIASLHAGALRNKPCQHANALLIAAAPDLLEALTVLSDWVESLISDNECRPLENARASIAKATGEGA